MFSHLTNEYCKTVKADHFNINKATDSFNQSILRAASETIPRGARKNYRTYRTKDLRVKWPEPERRLKKTKLHKTT